MNTGIGDGARPSSSDYARTSNPSQIIDEGNHTISDLDLSDYNSDQENWKMFLNDSTSPQRQCDGQASGSSFEMHRWLASFHNPPGGESSSASMSLGPSDAAIQQPAPKSHGDPEGIDGNYGAAMIRNLDHDPQYSLMIPVPTVNTPFANTKSYPPNGEGLSQGKQSDDKGKDHEGAGHIFPGITHRACSVANTYTGPPDALRKGFEITPGDPYPEKQQPNNVLGAKRPPQSLYPPRQFRGGQPYVNQVQSSQPTYDTRAAFNPLDSVTTGFQEPAHYIQQSQNISMVEPSARKEKLFSFGESYVNDEGSSQGKQPQHNGKDHEVAGSGRPGPGISHTVGKTCTKPVRRTPEKSARKGGKKQCGHIDADKAARIRSGNWMGIETLYLLLKKKEFSETPGESWSVRASEFLKSEGYDRTPVSCQQRWDTMKKHYDKRDQFCTDEGYVPAGFYNQSLLYDLMRIIMEGHGEQQSPSKDAQGSGQLEGAFAPSSAIHTDPIEFSNANGPSLPPDASIDDAYASGQDWTSNPSMQTRTGVHQKQQSLQNDTSRGGQMVDASAQSQGTQEPMVSSHDPRMIEMTLAIARPFLQEMEEKMKSSHDATMAAISAVRQEVKIMLESYMNGKN